MSNLGLTEILVVLVVALVVFGPNKLPELAKNLGKGIREFRRGTQGLKDELEAGLKDSPSPTDARPSATPAAPAPASQMIPPASVEASKVAVPAEAAATESTEPHRA